MPLCGYNETREALVLASHQLNHSHDLQGLRSGHLEWRPKGRRPEEGLPQRAN